MEHLEHPDLTTWDERRRWFEAFEQDRAAAGAAPVLSEQACALMIDLQATFCVGAWAASIILAATIADSQARQASVDPTLRAEIAWLRQTRNVLIHESPKTPALTVEDQWMNRTAWEREARRAVSVVFRTLYPEKTTNRQTEE